MQFCQKCGSLLVPPQSARAKLPFCPKCGYRPKKAAAFKLKEALAKQRPHSRIKAPEKIETLPKTNIVCPKCGNGKAYWWVMGTTGGEEEEPELQFYACTKCDYRWKESL